MKNKRYIATMVGMFLMLGASTTAYGQIVKGKVFGGGQLAQVQGDEDKAACNVTISSGSVYGQVYGAGEGMKSYETGYNADVAKVTGDAKVNIGRGHDGGGTAWRNVFGGGALAKVYGNTYVSMTGGYIAANLFGGGEGDIKMNGSVYDCSKITSADVTGNTNVEITGGDVVWDATSMTSSSSSSISTYIYTKNIAAVPGNSVTETSSAADQKSVIKESYEAQGYIDVTVSDPSGPTDGLYSYTVTYTIPATTLTQEFVGSIPANEQELLDDDYVKTTSTEDISTVEGEIVYWDVKREHESGGKTYDNSEDIIEVDGVKYAYNRFYDDANKRFKIEHNIFGGGYIACNVADTAYVTMTRGLGDNRLTKTLQWQQSFDDTTHPHFYAFGGGYGAYTTVNNTVVNVHVDDYDKTLDATVTNPDEQLAKPRRTATDGSSGTANPLEDNPIYMGIYNNEYGIANATVLGVLGGSYAGFVKENTDVTVGGETFISRVYGGGFGQLEAYNGLKNTDIIYNAGTQETPNNKTRTNLGEVGGNTHVHVIGANIYGNVYGGGAGVESAWLDGSTYKVLDKTNATATKDFTMGEVLGIAKVEISENANVFGKVFGGGDVANVKGTGADKERTTTNGTEGSNEDDYTTSVEIFGGHVYGDVFGGGSGREASIVYAHNTEDNSIAVGKVDGNAHVHIYNSIPNPEYDEEENPGVPKYFKAKTNDDEGIMWPYVYGNIYGGCAYGVVTGSTDVVIDGGMIGDNIFGGGLGHISNDLTKITSANVGGNTVVTINGGFALWNETSTENGDVKKWPKANYTARGKEIKDADALFYDYKTKRFVKDHNVYGGGNVACIVGTSGDVAKYSGSDYPKWSYPQVLKEGDYKTGNTVVMMNESHLGDPDLFMNYNEWTETPDWSLAAKCWQATLEEQREPQFSVFGAGKGLLTKTLHNSQARVEVLAVRYNIDGKLLFYQDASKSLDNVAPVGSGTIEFGAAEHWTTGWDEAYETKLQWNAEENAGRTEKDELANFYPEDYARPNYVDAERRLRTAAFAKQIGTAGNTVMQIIGGGYNGSVDGNSLASGESRAIIGKMYGGGYGSYEGWKLAKDLDKDKAPNYANKVGTVAGQSVLNIDRGCLVRSDVFAGGAGVESLKLDANNDVIPETAAEYKDAEYTDFTEVARVGSTHLKFGLLGASKGYEFVVPVVYGYVYGGGDVANVTGVAKSDFVRGQAMRYFFGGGNGRLTSQCNDYRTLGGVGATDVHFDVVRVANNPANAPDMYVKNYGREDISYNIEPIVWHRAFAGGRNGLVKGNTNMRIDGGQFGYNIFGGGEGTIDTLIVDGVETYEVTSADILGNTNIIVKGGNQNIDQIWDYVNYSWTKANKDDKGNSYSPQYDYKKTKFNINHNIYGGGRMACEVRGNTNIDMSKGMLNNQYFEKLGTPFLESVEWKEIYNKHASPHFCVFGGGFGKLATVAQDTHVNVNLSAGADNVAPSNNEFNNSTTHQHNDANKGYCGNTHIYNDIHNDNAYTKFPDGQSLMDVIGGGYSGEVVGTCYVTIDGNTFIRNIFGGAYYANAGASVVNVKQGNIDNIYGGGMMGDVKNTVTVNVGQDKAVDINSDKSVNDADATAAATANHEVVILGNVYGANDVAGIVGATESENGEVVPTYKNGTTETVDGATINLRGGHVYGSVYGGGNGDYLYMLDQNVAEVTAEEQYEIGGEKKLVYRVPIRKQDFPSLNTMSDAQKIVNLATYRPAIMKTKIDFKGNGTQVTIDENQFDDLLRVDGNIYGGGSSATISNFTGKEADSFVKLNVGSHIRVGGVYLGSDGDALFNTSGANNFIEDFPKLNNITLAKTVDWINDPTNRSIPEKYLPVPNKDRPNVYKNVLDLYFMPVEMNMMPEVTWNRKNSSIRVAANPNSYEDVADTEDGVTDAVIGTFCCGGNRGNMNTTTDFHVNFPEGLTITGNIIGGCNNSNDTKTDANGNVMSHTGGFLLGTHNVETGSVKRTPQIHLTMRNKFRPTMEDASGNVTTDASKLHMYREGNNVYGGCYHSGTVRGDILIDMRSNMINGLDSIALDRGGDSRAVCNVYGAGFGSGAWVYGDTQVLLGKDVADCSSTYNNDGRYTVGGASANYVYGGGQRGNVVGTTTVRIYNGRVAGCVVGASYAGNLYGSAQTIVGYPDTYYVCNTTGKYELTRVDQNHSDLLGDDGKPVVKRQIWHTKGDIVSEATYTELADADKHNFDEFNLTGTNRAEQPTDWSKVNIQIDQAIYGGGYALPDGSGSYTVRKYTSDRNLNSYAETVYGLPAGTTLDNDNEDGAYGGNTFVMIGDRVAEDTRDHITISSSQLVELHPSDSDELFGKYYKSDDGIVYINYPTTIALNSKFTNETKFYNFIGRGGLYGDGRLSLSEGYRVSDIRGYGYNGTKPSDAKLLNCLHRFDASRFTDCCVSILGDLDYTTNESGGNGAVKYAIARIGELQMVSSINDANALNVDVTSEGSVTQMGKRSRNYIGFSNVVRDLGAVWSNVPFVGDDSKHHDENGNVTASTTYKKYKQDIISANYNSQKAELRTDVTGASAEFQKRNNGTAKNMLGIASGFALRVENSFAEKMALSRDAAPEPVGANNNFYYGPAFGVFEIKLVNTRPGEAGGYVYAQNIHQEDIADEESHTVHDFMESTGNFVFPMSDTRKVVDDCYPYAYTKSERDNVNAIESKDGHYWYVTGMNYFYYGTITGYTFDSKNSPLNFNMNSKELRINLTGAKAGQDVTLKEFRMLKNHSSEFASSCDIENKFYTNKNTETNKGFYDVDWTTPNPTSYYKLSLSATADGVYKEAEETGEKSVPHIPALAEYVAPAVANTSEAVGKVLSGTLQSDNPYVAIRLTDAVNNNGKVEDGHGGATSYLKKYLDEACQAIIVLTTPAVDDNGARIYDAYEVSNEALDVMKENVNKTNPVVYYIIDGNGDYHSLTKSEVLALETKPEAVFVAVPDRYTALGEGEFDSNATYYVIDEVNGTLAPDGKKYSKVETPVSAEWSTYYTKQAGGSPKTYEYTINLTIKYIQGPSYEGKATVQNCALPGEMIRLSSSTVTITSDAIDMPQNGSMWTVGPGKKVYANDGTYTWVMDESQKTKFFTYNPKDDAEKDDVKASRGVLAKAYYEEDSKDLYIPAYYFMNGYVARYSYSVKGIFDDEAKTKPTMFHVTVFPEDTLLVHNYHRMDPTLGSERTPVETYILKAAERYASDVTRLADDKAHDADVSKLTEPRQTNMALSYVNRPRVYIEDVDDFKKFAEYVNASTDNADNPGNDYGNNLEFFLMTDLTVPDDWTAITNFKGIFHGNGHIINGLDTKSLFAANAGNIYNLGLLQGNITATETPAFYHCCYTKSNNTVYRMNGSAVTSYTEDDWKYGKVAYDLNQYYLEERHDLSDGADDHNHTGYVENIFANGDYQYARTYANDAREEYLRTNANPHYVISDFDAIVTNPEGITYHKTSHDVDESRAYYETVDEEPVFNEYYPLFEANKQNTTASVTTGKKNDYLFFGQTLNAATNLPATIASHLVSDMTNRVYRAFGYYQSKTDDLFHFNRQAYALQPTLTAIDFSGAHNENHNWSQGMKNAVTSTTGETPTVGNAAIFYPQVMDMPASFVSFNRAEGVTRNLLVYTPDADDKDATGGAKASDTYSAVYKALNYSESAEESKIEGHQVHFKSEGEIAPLLHLVDKQDFNAPIAFKATKAWYERKPVDETGYVETPGQSWESICLPYTVQKATLSNGLQMYDATTGSKVPELKKDITFFYGADNSSKDPLNGDEITEQTETNNNNIGHEYWLRYLNAYDASGSEATATFTRPTDNTFPAYVPAIVSFPGSRFYEFDMSYKNADVRENQKITFSAEDAGVTVTDDAVKSVVVEDAATYTGAFLNSENNDPDNVRCAIALKSETSGAMGDSFVKGNKIWAFRGYITTAAAGSSAKSRSVIYIANGNDTQEEPKTELKPEIPGHESESGEADDYLIIKVKGHTVLVTSSAEHKLPLVGVNGINYGIWNIPEGTSEFTVIAPGVYLLNGQKFVIR